jgi:hypothetical protein
MDTGQLIASHPVSAAYYLRCAVLCRWSEFSGGFLVGGLSGVAWAYIMTQVLPYYS